MKHYLYSLKPKKKKKKNCMEYETRFQLKILDKFYTKSEICSPQHNEINFDF